jgi:hypothetical protein
VTLGDGFDDLDVEEPRTCDCHESVVSGTRIKLPRFHSCIYVEARSRLVPRAVQLANTEVTIDCAESGNKWTAAFCRHMEALVAEAGLLNGA